MVARSHVGGITAARTAFANITTNDNAGDDANGIDLDQYSYNGASSATFTDIVVNNNDGDNLHAYVESSFDSGTSAADLTLTRVQADNSINEDGIYALAYSYGDGGNATVTMTDTLARNNAGYGVDYADAQAFGADSDARVALTRVTADGNHNDGIWGNASARDGVATFTMESCAARDNQSSGRGTSVMLYSGNGADQLRVRNCTFTGNASDGIEVDSSSAAQNLNLGDAAGTAGHNSIFNNGDYAIHNYRNGTVQAENNWWGTKSPARASSTAPSIIPLVDHGAVIARIIYWETSRAAFISSTVDTAIARTISAVTLFPK